MKTCDGVELVPRSFAQHRFSLFDMVDEAGPPMPSQRMGLRHGQGLEWCQTQSVPET